MIVIYKIKSDGETVSNVDSAYRASDDSQIPRHKFDITNIWTVPL